MESTTNTEHEQSEKTTNGGLQSQAEETEERKSKDGEQREDDEVEVVLSEWERSSKFGIKRFFKSLLPSALLSVFSIVSDGYLGKKFLETGLILQSENFTNFNESSSCRKLTAENLTYSADGFTTIFYAPHSYTCEKENVVFGIAILATQFLPGLQWYTTLETEHHFGRFLSSLLFPFFSILFKVTSSSIMFLRARSKLLIHSTKFHADVETA